MLKPRNETETHCLLKEVGKYVLWSWNYCRVATEVNGMWTRDWATGKNIIDVLGAKRIRTGFIPGTGSIYEWDVKGIEAKATLADFRNGFCQAPAYTYIIAPKGVIPATEIPENIGFIEVDFSTLNIVPKYYNKIEEIIGAKLIIKARKQLDGIRFPTEEAYRAWCKDTLEAISYRNAHELLFRHSTLPMTKNN